MIDSLSLVENKEIKCLDKGLVAITDVMPRLIEEGSTCDHRIVEAARVSYNSNSKKSTDEDLIRYLMRNKHTSCFEMVSFLFYIKAPLFVVQQLLRHRTAKVNQESGRYSVLKNEFWFPKPEEVRTISENNKQSSDSFNDEELQKAFAKDLEDSSQNNYTTYNYYINKKISKEQSRCFLGSNLFTSLYWKIDLHNLLHFVSLRSDSHAQKEMQVYSDAILSLIKNLVPMSIDAFNDYNPHRGAVSLSRLESEAIKNKTFVIDSNNKREISEWENKKLILGLG